MAKKTHVSFTPIVSRWALFLAVSSFAKRMCLHSVMPGTGKSSAGVMLAAAKDAECITLTMTDSMTASDMLGCWMPQGNGNFVWHDAPVGRAIRRAASGLPTVLLINEAHNAGPDAIHTLYGVLDQGKSAEFTLPNNETLRITDALTIIVTMNPEPKDVLPEAIVSRLGVMIDLKDEVSPMILEALPEHLRSMVADGRLASREAFTLVQLTQAGCDPFVAVQATLGEERTASYGDALAIALS